MQNNYKDIYQDQIIITKNYTLHVNTEIYSCLHEYNSVSFFKKQQIMQWLCMHSLWKSCELYSKYIDFSSIILYNIYSSEKTNIDRALKVLSIYADSILNQSDLFSVFVYFTKYNLSFDLCSSILFILKPTQLDILNLIEQLNINILYFSEISTRIIIGACNNYIIINSLRFTWITACILRTDTD